jgi:hypothetical protein
VSFIRDANFFPLNFAGTFTFDTDSAFNAANPYTLITHRVIGTPRGILSSDIVWSNILNLRI